MSDEILYLTVLGVMISYIVWVSILHKQEKLVFFYSYTDFILCVVVSILVVFLPFVLGGGEKNWIILVILYLFSMGFLFFIAYRANSKDIKSTLIVFFGQIFLSIVFIIVLFLALVLGSGFRNRQKGETQASYMKTRNYHSFGAVFGLAVLLSQYLCLNDNCSLPKNNGE